MGIDRAAAAEHGSPFDNKTRALLAAPAERAHSTSAQGRERGGRGESGAVQLMYAARDCLHRAAAAVLAAGRLSSDEVRMLRARYKAGARAKDAARINRLTGRTRGADARLQAVTHEYERLAAELAARVETAPDAAEPAPAPAPAPAATRKPRRRRAPPAAVELFGLPPARRRMGPDELAPDELSEEAMIAPVVRLMHHGASAADALRKVGLEPTPARKRQAQRALVRWRQHGVTHDRRRDVTRDVSVMTPAMQGKIVDAWLARPSANARTILRMATEAWKQEVDRARADGLEAEMPRLPTVPTVRALLKRLPKPAALERDRGPEAWNKLARPIVKRVVGEFANQYWQIDHCVLDTWVRVLVGTQWEVVPVWMTAVLDLYSRAPTGFVLSMRAPDAFSTAFALRHAIAAKTRNDANQGRWPARGKPLVLTPDWGADFRANSVELSIRSLGIALEFCPPHYPDGKAEIERFFGTLQREVLAAYPGYKHSDGKSKEAAEKIIYKLLTLAQLRRIIEEWIVQHYLYRPHDGLPGEGEEKHPVVAWRRSVRLEEADPAELDVLLLKADETRTIGNRGVRFTPPGGERAVYWAPELTAYWRHEVRIRYHPDSLESILVYDAGTNARICEAWRTDTPSPRFGLDDVQRARADMASRLRTLRLRGRHALELRMQELWAEADAEARNARGAKQAMLARAEAEAREVEETLGPRHQVVAAAVPDLEVESMLELLRSGGPSGARPPRAAPMRAGDAVLAELPSEVPRGGAPVAATTSATTPTATPPRSQSTRVPAQAQSPAPRSGTPALVDPLPVPPLPACPVPVPTAPTAPERPADDEADLLAAMGYRRTG